MGVSLNMVRLEFDLTDIEEKKLQIVYCGRLSDNYKLDCES